MNIRLANKNRIESPKSWDALREKVIVDKIREGDEERKPRSANEELALLRKSVKYLYDLIDTLHHDEIDNAEFMEYYSDVERCKAEAKAEMEETR